MSFLKGIGRNYSADPPLFYVRIKPESPSGCARICTCTTTLYKFKITGAIPLNTRIVIKPKVLSILSL